MLDGRLRAEEKYKEKYMKRFVFFVLICSNLLCVFAENNIFVLKAKEKSVYCFQFDSGISFFVDFSLEVQGYSDFGNSFLFSIENNNLLIFGKVALADFLSTKQIKKLTDMEKISAYYQWEKKYQEDECNNIFRDDIQITKNDNNISGYYKFYRNVSINDINDTETVATEGIVFVYGDHVIYINKVILKTQDQDESRKLLNLAFNSLKVTTKVFKPEEGWEIYSKL